MTREKRMRVAVAVGLVLCGVLAGIGYTLPQDLRVALLLRNTLMLGLSANMIALPSGVLLALLLLRTDTPGRRIGISMLAILLFVPLYLQAAAWDAGFGLQGWFSLPPGVGSTPLLSGWRAAIWIHGLAAIPWVLLIVGVGLRLVEPESEDAALLDGSLWQVFRRVTLPRSAPAIAVAALWVFVMTAGEIAVTDLYQVRTHAEEVYTNVPLLEFLPNSDVSVSDGTAEGAITVPSGTGFIGLLCLATLLATAYMAPTDASPTMRRRSLFRLGNRRWLALAGLIVAGLVLIGVPLGNLVYKAGAVAEQTGGEWHRYWSPAKCLLTIGASPWQFREEFCWSLLIGATSATLALGLAGPLAWGARRNTIAAFPALGLSAFCLAIPGPIIGLHVICLLNRADSELLIWLYDRSILPPVMAQLVRCLPIAVLVCWYALRSLAQEVQEAAVMDGAGPLVRFLRDDIPQRWSALAAAWWAAFAVSLSDLSASILTVPPGVTTVPIRVFGLLHSGVDDQVAGICLTMAMLSIVVGGVTIRMVRRADG